LSHFRDLEISEESGNTLVGQLMPRAPTLPRPTENLHKHIKNRMRRKTPVINWDTGPRIYRSREMYVGTQDLNRRTGWIGRMGTQLDGHIVGIFKIGHVLFLPLNWAIRHF